jgi:hypothetical protein
MELASPSSYDAHIDVNHKLKRQCYTRGGERHGDLDLKRRRSSTSLSPFGAATRTCQDSEAHDAVRLLPNTESIIRK